MRFGVVVLGVALGAGLPACEEGTGWYRAEEKLYQGIPVRVGFEPKDDALASKVWAYLRGVDDVFNIYRDTSELGRINRMEERAGVAISEDLARALRLSRLVHRKTAGAFDPTVGRLVRLWKKAAREDEIPAQEKIEKALASCGLDKVTLRGDRLSVACPGLRFDFGGLVKGLAVDRAVDMLRAGGARAALVQIGGETAAFGLSPQQRPHVIGIQHPERLDRIRARISAPDPEAGVSVSTSGNYRNPVVIGGKAFYHIVDPRTGRPADTRVLSVSVAFPQTGKNGLADGLTTACAVLGPKRCLPVVTSLGGQVLFLLESDGGITEQRSPGWDRFSPKQ